MTLFKKRHMKRLTALVQALTPEIHARRVLFDAPSVFALMDATATNAASKKHVQALKVDCLAAVDTVRVRGWSTATSGSFDPEHYQEQSKRRPLLPRLLILSSAVYIDGGDLAKYYSVREDFAMATLIQKRIAECAFALEVATLSPINQL